ncbi:MAG: DedA family protein [Cereibacter sphaeroides]|uniref:DedA family protein n=1 Tax=Cereibacter sphaeroides TaxID=1063 RepID=A0A2W5S1C7_CERSP|nr:MAG: DedA family protein [Cereibacter sphaeroides]
MQLIHDSAAFIHPYLVQYGVIAVFCLVYLEALGAPVPGESALIAASVLVIHHDFTVWHLMFGVWAGAVLGDCTGYLIGRVGGRRFLLRYGSIIKLTPERLETIEQKFSRYGIWIVIGARFVVLLRQLNGLVAGSVGMPWHKFLAANIIGGALWAAVWTLGPYFFGSHIHPEELLKKL